MQKKFGKKNKNNFPLQSIILISNSSWYLLHYRAYLIKKIKKDFKFETLTLAPKDKFSKELSSISNFIEWKISKRNTLNFFAIIDSFLRLYKILKNLRPSLIHSHTIKPNLLVAIISYLLNINTVFSFTGLGSLSKKKGSELLAFKLIIKLIYFFSTIEIKGFSFFEKNLNRSSFVFQNVDDIKMFKRIVNLKFKTNQINLIPGSGLPSFFEKEMDYMPLTKINKFYKSNFIYCARLLKSKGILSFLELSQFFGDSKFYVYGEIDENSSDSLTKNEVEIYKKEYENVEFKNFVKNPLLKHLKRNSILIVPSNYGEGLPRAILEALCIGLPVIATKEACSNNFTNSQVFIAENNKVEFLISQIFKIENLCEENKLDSFLNDAQQFVFKNYREELIVKMTIQIYKRKLKL